jgi:hypothetical protein
VLFGYTGHSYAELERYRDSLLRELVGGNVEEPIAKPSNPSSLKVNVATANVAAKSAEPLDAEDSKKGNPLLLRNQTAVNCQVAREYLGIGPRGLQKAIKAGKLDVIGVGQNKKVTVESLLRYLPTSDLGN